MNAATRMLTSKLQPSRRFSSLPIAYIDTPEENKKFAESLDLDYPILSDPDKSVAKAYGVVHEGRAVPERWTFYIGKDGTIQAIDKEVKPATSAEDMAAMLKQLGTEERKK